MDGETFEPVNDVLRSPEANLAIKEAVAVLGGLLAPFVAPEVLLALAIGAVAGFAMSQMVGKPSTSCAQSETEGESEKPKEEGEDEGSTGPAPEAPKKTQWGWEGSPSWKGAVKEAGKDGTHEKIQGKIPTQEEAEALIEEGGGKVDRVDEGHKPPNPHTYPHINYTTGSGAKGTVQIQQVVNPKP